MHVAQTDIVGKDQNDVGMGRWLRGQQTGRHGNEQGYRIKGFLHNQTSDAREKSFVTPRVSGKALPGRNAGLDGLEDAKEKQAGRRKLNNPVSSASKPPPSPRWKSASSAAPAGNPPASSPRRRSAPGTFSGS